MNRSPRPGQIDPSRILYPALAGGVLVFAAVHALAWLGALHGL